MVSFTQSYNLDAPAWSSASLFAPEASTISDSTPTNEFGKNPTADSYPWFLRCMDSDPGRAAEGVHRFVWKLLRSQPPPRLKCLSVEDREDVISQLVAYFIVDDFRVLRTYRDKGRPFAAFVAVAVTRRATSRLRQLGVEKNRDVSLEDQPDCPDHNPAPHEHIDDKRTLQRVVDCLDTLPERCQILIKAAAEGWKPRQMVILLGWPSSANTKVAEALRQCRRKLKRCLEAPA